MSRRISFKYLLAGAIAATLGTNSFGAPINWVLNPTDNSWTTTSNFDTNTVPTNADDVFFSNSNITAISSPAGDILVKSITFNSGAPAYVITKTGAGDITLIAGGTGVVENLSTATQTLNSGINLAGGIIKSTNGPIVFGSTGTTNYVYGSGAGNPANIWLTKDVEVQRLAASGPKNIYGPKGPATTVADMAGVTGTFIVQLNTGTSNSNNTTNYNGTTNIWSGAIRIRANNALGLNTATTFIHGTFGASSAADAQTLGGYEHGFGALELDNNITTTERVRLDGRIGDVADFDQLVNVSGNNTLGSGTNNTGINTMGGAGHYNFNSKAGLLTLPSNSFNIGATDGPHNDSTSGVNSVITFRGAGSFNIGRGLRQETQFGGSMTGLEGTVSTTLRKQGAGTLTLTSVANDWDGGTLIEGGTIAVTGSGVLSTVGSRVVVHSGATLDMSATAGLSLGATKRLNGSGLVKGNVLTTDIDARIQPGGTGSLLVDANPLLNDLLSYTDGAGKLTFNDVLNMNGSGRYDWSLDALDDTPANAGITYDQIVVNGGLALGTSSTLNITNNSIPATDLPGGSNDAYWHSNHSWVVVDQSSGANIDQFGSLTVFGNPNGPLSLNGGGVGNFSLGLDGNGDVVVNYTFSAVPEPSTFALAAVGLVGLGLMRKRRSK